MSLISAAKKAVSSAAHAIERAAVNTAQVAARTAGAAKHQADVFEHAAGGLGRKVLGLVDKVKNFIKPQADKKDDGLFVGAGRRTFPPNTPLADLPGVMPKNGPTNDETLIYVNGINTSVADQANTLQRMADVTGSKVVGLHNSTEGVVADLVQCLGDKLDKGRNPPVDTMAQTVYAELKAGRSVHLMAHSQGGLITSRALTDVKNRLMLEGGMSKAQAEQLLSKVKVETFGAASGHYPDGPQYRHSINDADIVPTLFGLGTAADRFKPLRDAGRGAEVIHFNEPKLNPVDAHSIDDVYLRRRQPF